jgi:putative transposase
MKTSKYTEEQIVDALRQVEAGEAVVEVCRRLGISQQTFYSWKKKYGGVGSTELKRMRLLEDENRKLKRLVADLSLDKHMLQEVIEKKL